MHHDGAHLNNPAHASGHGDIAALDTAALQSTLDHGGRELTLFPIINLLTGFAGSVLNAFLGVGAGEAVTAIFGSQEVPVDLAQLFDDALKQIDRIVGDRISEAFSNEKKALLDSLGRQVREYTRRVNLGVSRAQVQGMLDDASDLLAFFEDNGVVTNSAFQTTLALRLALLLELLQLDQLIGESEATLGVVRNSIRSQARSGLASLKDWAATFRPATNTESVRIEQPCGVKLPSGACRIPSSTRRNLSVCMDLGGRGLVEPDSFCKRTECTSVAIFPGLRSSRITSCLEAAERSFRSDVRRHANAVGIKQFRERNVANVFGEGFEQFLADLEAVEVLEFEDVSLPEVDTVVEPADSEA